ncbi:C-type lectin 37Db [Phlebotomus argentipes]|uniref:C-type lectin 37Db n=1 Tax=Phlebotomus argentipes TaxID=94469 RepID=UPI002892B2CB|nr:C-type lectin 37Db [Phlebotomus argentipes]
MQWEILLLLLITQLPSILPIVYQYNVVGSTTNNARVYQVGTKQIYVSNWRTNWHQAYGTCRSLGMQMVTIESDADNRNLWDFVNAQNLGECWLGGTDLGTEGNWNWFPTGRQFVYTRWAPGNPNNLGGQHCLQFWTRYPSFWDDDHCWREKFFMCEAVQCSNSPVQIQLPTNIQYQSTALQPQQYQVAPNPYVQSVQPIQTAVHLPTTVHVPSPVNGVLYVH